MFGKGGITTIMAILFNGFFPSMTSSKSAALLISWDFFCKRLCRRVRADTDMVECIRYRGVIFWRYGFLKRISAPAKRAALRFSEGELSTFL